MAYKKGSIQYWRTRYSKASSRIRSQIKKLESRYPESVALERGGLQDWGGVKTLPKDYTLKEIKRLTKYAEQTLASGVYSLQRHRRAYANASITLQSKGIEVNRRNLGAYFRFMDDLKSRGISTMKSSRWWARMFNDAQRRGMSRRDLMKNIDYWAERFEANHRYKPALLNSGSESFASES